MKKLILLLIIPVLFASCDKEEIESTQDYTSFVIVNNSNRPFVNLKTAYIDKTNKNKCTLIKNFGNVNAKSTTVEYIMPTHLQEPIYIYFDGVQYGCKLDISYILKENRKNTLTITNTTDSVYIDKKSDFNFPPDY